MKPLTSSALHFTVVILAFTLVACNRAVDEDYSEVSLILPAASQTNSMQSGLGSTSGIETGAPAIDSGETRFDSTIIPTHTGSKAINCYLVLVSDEDKKDFTVNYCGNFSANSTISDSLITDKQIEFGPYYGPFPATATNTTVSIPVKNGKKRIFKLLGFHAPDNNYCVSFKDSLNKSKLSRPYFLGASNSINLPEDGQKVVINYSQSGGDPSTSYQDCVVNDQLFKFLPANKVAINQQRFPFSYLRAVPNTLPPTKYCESVDIDLLNKDAAGNLAPGAFTQQTAFNLLVNNVTQYTFTTSEQCESNLTSAVPSSTGIASANTSIVFGPGQTSQKRWYVQTATSANVSQVLKVQPLGFDLESENYNFNLILTTPTSATSQAIFHYEMPYVIQEDKCYRVKTFIRDLNGRPVSATSVSSYGSGVTGISTYTDDACGTPTSTSSTTNAYAYYIKADGTYFENGASVNFSLALSPSGSVIVSHAPVKIVSQRESTITPAQIGTLKTRAKTSFKNSSDLCFPIYLSLTDVKGTGLVLNDYDLDVAGTMRGLSALKVFILLDPVLSLYDSGFTLHDNDTCSTAAANIFQPFNAPASFGNLTSINSSDNVFKLYLRPSGNSVYGKRKLKFVLAAPAASSPFTTGIGNMNVGEFEFELTPTGY